MTDDTKLILISDHPRNLAEWLARIKAYESTIFARTKRDGEWLSLPLSELTPAEWGEKVASMLESGRVPFRVKSDAEISGESHK